MEQLSKENEEKFTEILLKIRFSDINAHDAEEFSHHCLDIFLQAEKEQVPVETLLNTYDLDGFCNEYIAGIKSGYSVFQKYYWKFSTMPIIIFIFLGIWEMLGEYLVKARVDKYLFVSIPVKLSMIINTMLLIIAIMFLIEKIDYFNSAFNSGNKRNNRIATFLLWVGFCLITGLFVVSNLIFTQVLFHMNYLLFMGILGTLCLLQHLYENKDV
ncbi:MAG: hypothetical protein WBH44_02895 [Proteocatella sp.]